MKPWIIATTLVLASSPAASQSKDTLVVDVGSTAVNARFINPHAARVKVYRGDTLVAQWTNELTVGDSGGRRVMRWVTTGEAVPANPNRPLGVLRQTYDATTLAPLGYANVVNNGTTVQLSITGVSVRGTRRIAGDTATRPVNITLDKPGFFSGASDLVPLGVGLKPGTVFLAPLWTPNSPTVEYRVFAVIGDTTVNVEGSAVRASKVEERRRRDGGLIANWYLLAEDPYMVYGEVLLPDGRIQRMTEVSIRAR